MKKIKVIAFFITTLLSIAIGEAIIMIFLHQFLQFSYLTRTLIDVALLALLTAPTLYLFFYRPLTQNLNKCSKMEGIFKGLAMVDELTGLYNRRGFKSFADQLIQLARRTKKGLLLFFLDVNNMKEINDRFGHAAGDSALRCVAKKLGKTFRSSDTIGRIGGDEFAVLAIEAEQASIDTIRSRLQQNLAYAECNEKGCSAISMSIGIVYYDPAEPCDIDTLLQRADALMYKEKRGT